MAICKVIARLRRVILGTALALCAVTGHAEQYPARPITLLGPAPAGGTSDTLARVLAERMTRDFGQGVIVQNRPGANGLVATETLHNAAPDGYTLLLVNPGFVTNQQVYANVRYDPLKDFSLVTLLGTVPMVVMTSNTSGIHSLADLLTRARAAPGKVTFGSGGIASSNQLATELFAMMTGVKMYHIPYKGDTPGITDLLGGRINVLFLNEPVAAPLAKSHQLTALAITSAKRSAALPQVPAIGETVPGYNAGSWFAIVAPKGLPAPVMERLSKEFMSMLADPAMRGKLQEMGVTVVGSTPEQLKAFLNVEITKWGKVIKDANIKL